MKKLRLFLFIATLQFFTFNTAHSNHVIGGYFKIYQISANDFEVNLIVYRDCNPGNAPGVTPPAICVFDAVTHAQVTTFSMSSNLISQQVLPLGDSCCFFPTLCVEEFVFQTPVTLADNPNGYYFTFNLMARKMNQINIFTPIGAVGLAFYTQIPDPALWSTTTVNGTNGNSSPAFTDYLNEAAVMSVGNLNVLDFSSTDADGDSLSYSLIEPIDALYCVPQPFTTIVWNAGFSATNILGNITSPTMTINPVTGQIICYPEIQGIFTFAVKVEEWRNGLKLGEVVQDIYFNAVANGAVNNVGFSASSQSLNTSPFSVQFSNVTPNPTLYNFTWDFGDGNTVQDNNLTVTHEYQDTGVYHVSLLAVPACVLSGSCMGETNYKPNYITCTNTTSSISYEISEVALFPNPSKDVVTLVVEQDLLNSTYVILDQLGKIVGKGNITALSTILDISGYNKGLYFIQIGENKEPLKVVIQ
jgi:PKD repeat protein